MMIVMMKQDMSGLILINKCVHDNFDKLFFVLIPKLPKKLCTTQYYTAYHFHLRMSKAHPSESDEVKEIDERLATCELRVAQLTAIMDDLEHKCYEMDKTLREIYDFLNPGMIHCLCIFYCLNRNS